MTTHNNSVEWWIQDNWNRRYTNKFDRSGFESHTLLDALMLAKLDVIGHQENDKVNQYISGIFFVSFETAKANLVDVISKVLMISLLNPDSCKIIKCFELSSFRSIRFLGIIISQAYN